MKTRHFLTALLLCFTFMSRAQDPLAKIKIFLPADRETRGRIMGEFEIDHFLPSPDGSIIAEIPKSMLGRLQSSGYKHQVLIEDISMWLKAENERYFDSVRKNPQGRAAHNQTGRKLDDIIAKPAAFEVKSSFGGYYSFAEMEAAMDELVADYPSIASKVSLGTTHEGRNIWCIKISDNVGADDNNEPDLLYMGLQHAREAVTGASMIFFMQYLCENYGIDQKITQLVNNREFYIIPCFNPDGWEYNRTYMSGNPGGTWRKNRFPTGGSTTGVDLNRNWGVDWGDCSAPIMGSATSCGTSTKSADTYWGASAFSEKETQAVRTLTYGKKFVIGFDQHAYGPYYSLPFGRKSKHVMPQKGIDFYTAVPALMGTYNGMRAADSYDALGYEVAGGFKDWMLMGDISPATKDTVWGMTGEGGAGGGTSSNFWAPASQIVNLCKGMCFQNLQLAYAAGTYVDVQDTNPMALSTTTGNFNFRIRRIGLGNEPVTVSVIPLENIQSVGSAVTVNSMTYYGTATGSIAYTLSPSVGSGHRVRFAWQVSAGGITYTDTVVKFLNPTLLFSDDMEGSFANNWSNTASNVASGFGYNYTARNWSFTTSGGYNSTKALSESAAGTNYVGTSIQAAQYKNALNLTGANHAYLTFWTRYRAENFRDKLQVQVSTNGGSSWAAIRGNLTVEEAGTLDGSTINGIPALTGVLDYWTPAVYDLSAYTGNSSVLFRFVFTSDNDGSSFKFEVDDGFYIDDVQVYKANAVMVVLPVKFESVEAKLHESGSVKVSWKAQTDTDHSHFEVEHSTDGIIFNFIGRVETAPYNFIHQNPSPGVNYYRIRNLDKDGSSSLSKVVSVVVKNAIQLKLYPNPAANVLNIAFRSEDQQVQTIEIIDVNGRIVYTQQMPQAASQLQTTIRVEKLQPQVYLLRLRNSQGALISLSKWYKQ